MAAISQVNGAFHLRIYSSVNISTGEPLGKLTADGKPVRVQQMTMLARVDDEHTSPKSWAVQVLANAKTEEIRKWEASAVSGDRKPNGNMLVRDFFENVFMPHIKAQREASTAKSYQGYWDAYLRDHFNGTRTLKGYEAFTGTNFLETLCEKYSDNTVDHVRALASSIFKYATGKGYIKANPWREVVKTSSGQDVDEGHAYTELEVERILDALERVAGREDRSAELAGMLISLCFFAGLRPSEAIGLRWENITGSRLLVKNAFVQGDYKRTKNKKVRTLDILPKLAHRLAIWAMKEGHPADGWIFPNRDGKPANVNDLSSRVIAKTLAKVGLDWHGLYAMRRGFGTMMVLAGATLTEVADAMGNTQEVVEKHYFKDKTSQPASKGMAKLAAAMAGGVQTKILALGEGQ